MLSAVLPILSGAAFTVAVATAMGLLLLRYLRLSFAPGENALLAFVTGSACLSLAVFFLCLAHLATIPAFLALGLPAILAAFWQSRVHPPKPAAKPLPTAWLILFLAIFAAFFLAYFFNALAPEISPDGSGYHLGNVARFWRHHGFVWDYHSMYSYLSQGIEMLFLVAFSFGRHSATALVHFAFLTALPLLMVCYGRRFGFPRPAFFAAIVAFTCPVAGLSGTFAYNDLAVATVLFAVFYLLQVWDELRIDNLLLLIGFLSGFAYALKYTACLALPFAITFVYWRTRSRRCLYIPLAAALEIAPWTLRNWIWLGNPFAPFLNRLFPNPYFHPGIEQSYLADLARYEGINHFWEIPLQLTLHGALIPGIIGPVLLLAPFGLLALRHPHGRRLLAAALVFAIPAYFNTAARFLIPAIPFLALAMGIAFSNSRGVLPALAVFEALVCWPAVLSMYCAPTAWRIHDVPVRAALRLVPESQFLATHLPGYDLKDPIERLVPPGQKIFSFAGRPEAYIARDIVVWYESALGNLAQDILYTPLYHPPVLRRRFAFAPQNARAVRVVESAAAEAYWTVTELRLRFEGRELPRSEAWRATARPNPWEASLAFDGSPVTRWSTWQPMSPDSRLEVDFPRDQSTDGQTIDEVILEGPPDAAHVSVEVSSHGRWLPVGGPPEESPISPPPDLRLAANRQLAGRGIRYLLINDADFLAADLKEHATGWHIAKLAEANATTLYRLD